MRRETDELAWLRSDAAKPISAAHEGTARGRGLLNSRGDEVQVETVAKWVSAQQEGVVSNEGGPSHDKSLQSILHWINVHHFTPSFDVFTSFCGGETNICIRRV